MDAVKLPYVGLGIAFVILAAIFADLVAGLQPGGQDRGWREGVPPQTFCLGLAGDFFYVGSEVTVGSILINYLKDPGVMGMAEDTSAKFLSFYWGGTMTGRLMGAISLSNVRLPRKYFFMALARRGDGGDLRQRHLQREPDPRPLH